MTLTYLAGYDGSDAARAAVRLTKRMGEALGARVLAVYVYEPVPIISAKGESRAEREHGAHEAADHLLAELAEPDVETRAIAARSPARGLQEAAEEEGASLLAVGATHRGELGRLVAGSVADRLLHGAPCPVAVVPAGSPANVTTIAVAYDGGDEAEQALTNAQPLATKIGARLVLLAAVEPEAYPLRAPFEMSPDELDEHLRDRMRQKLAETAERMPPDLPVATRVVPGSGGPALVAACAERGADMLFTGSRGYGPIRSVLLGTVSRYLVDHAPCAVVVVPRGVGAALDRPPARPVTTSA